MKKPGASTSVDEWDELKLRTYVYSKITLRELKGKT
jgi:hypothetical protein